MKQNTNADEAQTQVNTLADVSVGDTIEVNHRDETETVVEVTDTQIKTEIDGRFERTHGGGQVSRLGIHVETVAPAATSGLGLRCILGRLRR